MAEGVAEVVETERQRRGKSQVNRVVADAAVVVIVAIEVVEPRIIHKYVCIPR